MRKLIILATIVLLLAVVFVVVLLVISGCGSSGNSTPTTSSTTQHANGTSKKQTTLDGEYMNEETGDWITLDDRTKPWFTQGNVLGSAWEGSFSLDGDNIVLHETDIVGSAPRLKISGNKIIVNDGQEVLTWAKPSYGDIP